MYKEALRTVWAEIDLDALRYNIRNIRAKVGKDRKVYGVITARRSRRCSVCCQESSWHH